jgi:hypothetical protein
MATMSIIESEHIIDLVVVAFDRHNDSIDRWWHAYKPLSVFQGYDVFQIDIALKLRVSNMFLYFSARNDFEEQFEKEITWSQFPFFGLHLFIPDDLMVKIKQWDKDSKTLSRDSDEYFDQNGALMEEVHTFEKSYIEDKKYLSLETSESFGNYCKSLGANDPLYWQKIYTRLGLEYTPTSPKGNAPAYTK